MWQKLWDYLLYHLICRWPKFVISIQKLCSGDWDRTIRISVWDWNRYNVSQSLTSLPGLSNDHMHSLASRLFLVTSFTCSTCYKQQSQLRPGNEASLLTVSISRSYSVSKKEILQTYLVIILKQLAMVRLKQKRR